MIVIAGYAVFAGGVAAWRYVVLVHIVDDALTADRKLGPGDRPARIRHMVLRGASEADVPLSPDEIEVSADGEVVTVRVRHVYRAAEYQTARIDIPITLERSLAYP